MRKERKVNQKDVFSVIWESLRGRKAYDLDGWAGAAMLPIKVFGWKES